MRTAIMFMIRTGTRSDSRSVIGENGKGNVSSDSSHALPLCTLWLLRHSSKYSATMYAAAASESDEVLD